MDDSVFPFGGFKIIKYPMTYLKSAETAGSAFFDNFRFPFSDLDIVIQKGIGFVIAEFKKFSWNGTLIVRPTQRKILNLLHRQIWYNEVYIVGVDEYEPLEPHDLIHVATLTDIGSGEIPVAFTPLGMKIKKKDMHITTVEEFRNDVEYLLDKVFPQPLA